MNHLSRAFPVQVLQQCSTKGQMGKAEQLPGCEQSTPASTFPLIPQVPSSGWMCHIPELLLWPPTYSPLHITSPTSKDEGGGKGGGGL